MKFALYFGNRGFFPGELAASARSEMTEAVRLSGNESLLMDESLTKFGAVETLADGEKFAEFLKRNNEEIDGVIMCLPNFSDENGAVAALKDFKKPILIQAYPDEIGKMSFELRRDSYCGKLSIMDMFTQYGIKFTVFKPHVINPLNEKFIEQIKKFAKICKTVNNLKNFKIGAIGARTTAFKTVRFDELTLQHYGITVDTIDLSEVFDRVLNYKDAVKAENLSKELKNYADFALVPADKIIMMAKTILVIKEIVADYRMDAIALRCWNEFPQILHFSACSIVSYLNDIGIPCACELDVCNAIAMQALTLATDSVTTCLDWNNNYGEQEDKCILFHCGPVAQSLMTGKGKVTDHKMFAKSYGKGCAFGSNEGRIKPGKFTFASAKTDGGKLQFYIGDGEFTDELIEEAFFGCGAVAKIDNLEDIMLFIGKNGYRHHVSVAFGEVKDVLEEVFSNYLNYDSITLTK